MVVVYSNDMDTFFHRGKLFFAPIDTEKLPCRVLDIGTGTGIWAIDMIQYVDTIQVLYDHIYVK